MMSELVEAIPLMVVLFVGSFIQSAAGFAAGLVIIPAMLWFGYSVPAAQCSLLVASTPQVVWGYWAYRDQTPARLIFWPAVGRLTFLPVGVLVLKSMEDWSEESMRQIVGGLVLAATLAIVVIRPEPREKLHPLWGIVAFSISGFFQGLVGIGGPAMVLWVQAHDWTTQRSRGFLFALFLVGAAPALLLLYLAFGAQIIKPGLLALAMVPLVIVATVLGLRFGTWLGPDRLRTITFVLLIINGLACLFAPLF